MFLLFLKDEFEKRKVFSSGHEEIFWVNKSLVCYKKYFSWYKIKDKRKDANFLILASAWLSHFSLQMALAYEP